jgi:hypothetical protein
MSDRPSDPDAPIQQELALPRWVMLSVVVLGILTVGLVGTAVAISTTGSPDGSAASASAPAPERTTPTPTATTASTPLANVDCDGSYIVELGRSDPPFKKSSVEKLVSDTKDAKYLQANRSCATYKGAGKRLIAYLGPFESLSAACEKRVESRNLRAVPHQMDPQQRGRNYCACEVDLPVLQVSDGEDGDRATLMAISEAQQILKTLGYFEPAVVGDPYGPQTFAAVQAFQADVGLPTTGVVNRDTWAALRRSTAPGGPPLC